ncbi:MAG: serine hydrolase [Gemmatimonadota bacterium]
MLRSLGTFPLLVLGLLTATSLPAQTTGALPKDLDAYVLRTLKELDQPGVAIAVVKDGKVVLTKGWGVRRLGDPSPVDEHTLFQIASNTKAMTAAALATLVHQGKLHWDDKVTDYLPWFQLGGDAYVSRELTIRDLLCHRSGLGLGAGDLLWFHSDLDRDGILHRLKYITPTASFRSRYAYDNVLFIAAGQIVAAASGMSWDQYVKRNLFTPLGMTETQTSVTQFTPGENVAAPHGASDGHQQVIAFDTVDNIGGAGAVNSNVADMAKWLRVQLDSGRVDAATQLWTPAEARQMWEPQTILPIGNPSGSFRIQRPNFAAYAMGWGVRDYRGQKLVTHSGGLAGMLSRVMLVPDQRLGIVVLSNGESSSFESLAWYILDSYLGAPRTDWTAAYKTASDAGTATDRAYEDSIARARDRSSKPSLTLERYAGRYTDAWYGDVTIALEGDHLVLHWSHSPALTADLEHWQYDTFRARMRIRNVADAWVTFSLRPDGSIDEVKLLPLLPSTDFSFNYQDLLFRPAGR